MSFIIAILIAAAVSAFGSFALGRNLRRRKLARQIAETFFAIADDLVGKEEFPKEHAALLVTMSSLRPGMLTRFVVVKFLVGLFTGMPPAMPKSPLSIDRVPHNLRKQYVRAMLSFIISDSFRCALLGPVFRRANGWIEQALKEIEPDVNAHATRAVTDQIVVYSASHNHVSMDQFCAA